jgi:oxygen-dependent protoporphyrinogen oxidase
VEELGLGGELLALHGGGGGGGRVLVLRKGRLEELPAGLQLVVPTDLREVFRSRLLSFSGKVRVALDLLRRPTGGSEAADEAVAPFLRRHFGAEYVDRIAGPLLAGIHATDPERLSLRAAFPQLPALAARHGSLVRGARRSPEGGGPSRVGLSRGMGSLVDALVRQLDEEGVELATGRPVAALDPLAGPGPHPRVRLTLAGGATLEADGAVLATPPGAAASLLASAAPEAARALREIPATTTATVSLGFRRGDVGHPLDALGFLVAAGEGRAIGGCTFSSSKFPGRAPAGTVLLRAYLGTGPGSGRAAELPADDDALAALALADLREVLGLTGEPLLVRVHRFPAANPQYLVGHRERVAAVEAAVDSATRLPPLALAGAAYHGLGIPDCIAGGRRAAERVLAGLCSPTGAVSGPGPRRSDR